MARGEERDPKSMGNLMESKPLTNFVQIQKVFERFDIQVEQRFDIKV